MERKKIVNQETAPIIELVDIVKEFEDKTVLDNVNLKINRGEFVTLLGPSGSGKTTILRIIGGFEWVTRGEVKFNGKDIKDLEPYKRNVSTIFQDYALFPHLNVENNIKYGLRLKRLPRENINKQFEVRLKAKQNLWNKKATQEMKKLDKLMLQCENQIKKTIFWIVLFVITLAPIIQNFGYIKSLLIGIWFKERESLLLNGW